MIGTPLRRYLAKTRPCGRPFASRRERLYFQVALTNTEAVHLHFFDFASCVRCLKALAPLIAGIRSNGRIALDEYLVDAAQFLATISDNASRFRVMKPPPDLPHNQIFTIWFGLIGPLYLKYNCRRWGHLEAQISENSQASTGLPHEL